MNEVKYRCVRTYPGGPEVGYISKPHKVQPETDKDCHYYNHNWFNPEGYPEYWEKIVDKDYEILAFRLKNSKYPDLIRWKNSFGLFPSGSKGDINNRLNEFSEESLLKSENGYEIYSVKRLSGSEIFTIGDKIILDNWMQCRKYVQIDEIYYNEHNQLSFRTTISPGPETFIFGLSDINYKIYKEPIFTTEDGVEMFEGNKYYAVYSTWLCDTFNVSKLSPLSHTKNFSSRELANKYIEENKPQFSKKDMMNFHNCSEVCFDLWYSKYKK